MRRAYAKTHYAGIDFAIAINAATPEAVIGPVVNHGIMTNHNHWLTSFPTADHRVGSPSTVLALTERYTGAAECYRILADR